LDPNGPANSDAVQSDLAEWTRISSQRTKRSATVEREQDAFHVLIQSIGDVTIEELNHEVVDVYKATRLETCSKSTLNTEIRILNYTLKQAYSSGNLKSLYGPFSIVPGAVRKIPVWLTSEQTQKILTTNDIEFKKFLQLLLYTGMRRNEALQITWDDIDLSLNQITIRKEICKTNSSRKVVICNELKLILEQWYDNQTGLLFPNYGTNQISMKFRRWVRQLDLPDNIKLKSLRSTFACHLLSNGDDIYTISQLLGHTSVKVTEKYYLALDEVKAKDAVDQLRFS
jgi:integrase